VASNVEIANRALDKIGHTGTPIVNIASDNTKASKLIGRLYDVLRRKELSTHYWKFAKTRVTLAPDATTTDYSFAYQYELPADFLRVYKIDSDFPYEIVGRKILTNDGPVLYFQYIADVIDPNLYDPLFIEAFAALIAKEIVEPMTDGSIGKRQLAMADYTDLIFQAKLMDAIQEPPIDIEEGSWIESRY